MWWVFKWWLLEKQKQCCLGWIIQSALSKCFLNPDIQADVDTMYIKSEKIQISTYWLGVNFCCMQSRGKCVLWLSGPLAKGMATMDLFLIDKRILIGEIKTKIVRESGHAIWLCVIIITFFKGNFWTEEEAWIKFYVQNMLKEK